MFSMITKRRQLDRVIRHKKALSLRRQNSPIREKIEALNRLRDMLTWKQGGITVIKA